MSLNYFTKLKTYYFHGSTANFIGSFHADPDTNDQYDWY